MAGSSSVALLQYILTQAAPGAAWNIGEAAGAGGGARTPTTFVTGT
jgi:hypothetical protein